MGRNSGYFTVDENGRPLPLVGKPVTAQYMQDYLQAALAEPYDPDKSDDDINQDNAGMPHVAAGARHAARRFARGEMDAIGFGFDRICGKATQQVNSMNVTVSLHDYLAKLSPPTPAELATIGVKVIEDTTPNVVLEEIDWL